MAIRECGEGVESEAVRRGRDGPLMGLERLLTRRNGSDDEGIAGFDGYRIRRPRAVV